MRHVRKPIRAADPRGLIKRLTPACTSLLSIGYEPDRSLLLCGSPRSGTTWLGSLMAAGPRTAQLFEPLHPEQVPGARVAGFRWRTHLPPDADWPTGEAFIGRVLRGDVLTPWTTRELDRPQRVTRWIIKLVRANRLLPWLARRFPRNPQVLLLRHPCAVVASQLRQGWHGSEGPIDEDHPFGDAVTTYVASLRAPEERAAAQWALDTLVPMSCPTPWPWDVVFYEHLIGQPPTDLEGLLARHGLRTGPDLGSRARRISTTSDVRSVDRGASWQQELRPDQVRRILGVVRELGVTTYDRDPLPRHAEPLGAPGI